MSQDDRYYSDWSELSPLQRQIDAIERELDEQPLMKVEDVSMALTGFAISLAAAMGLEDGNAMLGRLAGELRSMSKKLGSSLAGDTLDATAIALETSDPGKPE